MKPSIPILVVVLMVSPVLGQTQDVDVQAETFLIEHFSYNPSMQRFLFRGKTKALPEGTQLIASLVLRGQTGKSDAVYVDAEGKFSGEFETEGRDVLSGTYSLKVHVRRDDQQGEVLGRFPAEVEEDAGSKIFGWKTASIGSEHEKIRRAIADEIAAVRTIYDKSAQLGATSLKKVAAALGDGGPDGLGVAERERLLNLWLPFYKSTAGALEKRASDFEEKWLNGVFISPYQKAARGVVGLCDFVDRLRSSYTVEILRRLGMADQVPAEDAEKGRFAVAAVISQVNAVAWSIQSDLGTDLLVWMPTIEIAKERGRLEGQSWISSTSGFRIDKPNDGWTLVTGDINSTLRVAVNLQSEGGPCLATMQVHMVEFPWAETKEELIEAWERLAEYEWPNYGKVRGEWVKDEKEREYYAFDFRTRSENVSTVVTCRLYPRPEGKRKHVVYGLMEVAFYESIVIHHFEQDFKTIRQSFQLLEE